jgi:SAM-dependent methyltransferase
MKRLLWNTEFSNGRWECLDDTAVDCLYPFVEKYGRDGSILDLGCGSGNTATEVATVYSDYTGVDISDVAIRRAFEKSISHGRAAINQFAHSDIASYVPKRQHDVVLFRDSIYYIPLRRMLPMLNRYSTYLKDRGVFIVRLWGSEKNAQIVAVIEKHFKIVEKYSQHDPTALILVFR